MKKIIVFIIITIMLVGCNEQDVSRNKTLEAAWSTAVTNAATTHITLTELTDFEWNQAYLFSPYTDEKRMKDVMGISFKDASDLYRRDDLYVVVFTKDEKVIQYAQLQRHGHSFNIEGNETYVTPENSRIIINSAE